MGTPIDPNYADPNYGDPKKLPLALGSPQILQTKMLLSQGQGESDVLCLRTARVGLKALGTYCCWLCLAFASALNYRSCFQPCPSLWGCKCG